MRMYETTTRSRRQTAHGFVRHHMPVRVDLSGMGCDAGSCDDKPQNRVKQPEWLSTQKLP